MMNRGYPRNDNHREQRREREKRKEEKKSEVGAKGKEGGLEER